MAVLPGALDKATLQGAVNRILALQRADGTIPWYDAGVWDPWNHCHAAMGLAVIGERAAAERAYSALAARQNPDGSWWAQYGAAVPLDGNRYQGNGEEPWVRDTNYCAYPAAAVLHHYLLTEDMGFLRSYWPMVERAITFVLQYQSEHGEIRWSAPDPGTPQDDALVTGCSSIYKSLECAIRIAELLDHDASAWRSARRRLGEALRDKPERFDRQWEKKDYFSMDWYYPVLSGVYRDGAARARIDARWGEFVAEGRGCRCVLQQPWVTIAESCELVLALLGAGMKERAQALWSWQHQWRAPCGAYWMGWQFEEDVPWPHEQPAWTNAAVILAADALSAATPASRLMTEVGLDDTP
ncbi:MAG TPA: prenyltransferase [Alphaproteobacteria bacterium]|nr:prenyltransferase [Alphaproteobacteria bacterium]